MYRRFKTRAKAETEHDHLIIAAAEKLADEQAREIDAVHERIREARAEHVENLRVLRADHKVELERQQAACVAQTAELRADRRELHTRVTALEAEVKQLRR